MCRSQRSADCGNGTAAACALGRVSEPRSRAGCWNSCCGRRTLCAGVTRTEPPSGSRRERRGATGFGVALGDRDGRWMRRTRGGRVGSSPGRRGTGSPGLRGNCATRSSRSRVTAGAVRGDRRSVRALLTGGHRSGVPAPAPADDHPGRTGRRHGVRYGRVGLGRLVVAPLLAPLRLSRSKKGFGMISEAPLSWCFSVGTAGFEPTTP